MVVARNNWPNEQLDVLYWTQSFDWQGFIDNTQATALLQLLAKLHNVVSQPDDQITRVAIVKELTNI